MQFNPSNMSNVSGIKQPILRYEHDSNPTIQPISLDKTTGIWTTDTPIGLPVGVAKDVLPAMNFLKTGCIPREFSSVNTHKIEPIDDYNFYVYDNNVKLTSYPNTSNTAVDPLSVRFEYNSPASVTLNLAELNLTQFKIILRGQRGRSGWSYIYYNFDHDRGNFNAYYNGITDGRDFLNFIFEINVRFSPYSGLFVYDVSRFITRSFNNSNGNWDTTVGYMGNSIIEFYEFVNFNSMRLNFQIANKTVVEIYESGWSE